MAFNYRANNAKEIISKKKEFSLQAAEIYSYISKTYGEKIVLDPNKDFSDVKIPRAVEKKIGIAALKQTLAKKTDNVSRKNKPNKVVLSHLMKIFDQENHQL